MTNVVVWEGHFPACACDEASEMVATTAWCMLMWSDVTRHASNTIAAAAAAAVSRPHLIRRHRLNTVSHQRLACNIPATRIGLSATDLRIYTRAVKLKLNRMRYKRVAQRCQRLGRTSVSLKLFLV